MNRANLDIIHERILEEIKKSNNLQRPVQTKKDARVQLKMLVDLALYCHSKMTRQITITQDSNILMTTVEIDGYEYGFSATKTDGSFKFSFIMRDR